MTNPQSSPFSAMTIDSLPFDKAGKFYRGNIHGHSNISDGRKTVPEVINLYQSAGYDFVSITDHFLASYGFPITDTTAYRSDSFTTIPGAELHIGSIKFGGIWHLVAVGLPHDFAPYPEGETPAQLVKRALDTGAFVSVPHPNWYTLTTEDVLSLGQVHAVECYNATAEGHNDRAYSWHFVDTLVSMGLRISSPAVDDTHYEPNRDDFARGWVYVKSESLTPDALVTALKAGHYYSSTGAQLHHIDITPDKKVRVTCSPAEAIQVTGYGAWVERVSGHGLTYHEFDISKWRNLSYCRVTVINREGGRAWSNPVWFE